MRRDVVSPTVVLSAPRRERPEDTAGWNHVNEVRLDAVCGRALGSAAEGKTTDRGAEHRERPDLRRWLDRSQASTRQRQARLSARRRHEHTQSESKKTPDSGVAASHPSHAPQPGKRILLLLQRLRSGAQRRSSGLKSNRKQGSPHARLGIAEGSAVLQRGVARMLVAGPQRLSQRFVWPASTPGSR